MNEAVIPVAVIGFGWADTWKGIHSGQRMFRRDHVPACFPIVEPQHARMIIRKLDRWQVIRFIDERGRGTPGEVAVMNKHRPGWWHELMHLMLGNDPRWNDHQSREKVKWALMGETIMGVTPLWRRMMRLSKVDRAVLAQRLPTI